MKSLALALVGLAAAGPVLDLEARDQMVHAHHHVHVQRYAVPNCIERSKIAHEHDVKAFHCETFDKDDPGYLSFRANITYNRKHEIGTKAECRLYVYEGRKCRGREQVMDDIHVYEGQCQSQSKIFGRSIQLKCLKRSDQSIAWDFHTSTREIGGIPGIPTPTVTVTKPVATTLVAITQNPPPGSAITVNHSPIFIQAQTVTVPVASQTVVTLTVPDLDAKTVVTVPTPPIAATATRKFKTITTTMAVSDYLALQAAAKATATATVHVGIGN